MKIATRLDMLFAMDRYFQWVMLLCLTLLLAACGTMRSSVLIEPAATAATPARTPVPGGSYIVAQGDTLYSIAFRKGVDFRDLAQWNQVAPPYTIWPGQRLRLSPPAHPVAAAAPPAPAVIPATAPVRPAAAAPHGADNGMFQPVAPVAEGSSSTQPTPAGVPGTAPAAPVANAPAVAPAPAPNAPTAVPVAGEPPSAPAAVPAPAAAVPAAASHAAGGLMWRWPANGSVVKRFQSGEAIPGIEISGHQGDPVRAAADGVVVYSGNGLVGYGELVIIKHSDSLLSAYAHSSKRLVKEGQRVSAGQQIAEMGSTGASRVGLGFQVRKDGNPVDPLAYLPPR